LRTPPVEKNKLEDAKEKKELVEVVEKVELEDA
jgi:hypothetical protein